MNNKKLPSNFKDPQLGRLKKDIINKHHPAVANKNFMDDRFMSRSSYVDEPVEVQDGLGYVFEDEVEAVSNGSSANDSSGNIVTKKLNKITYKKFTFKEVEN